MRRRPTPVARVASAWHGMAHGAWFECGETPIPTPRTPHPAPPYPHLLGAAQADASMEQPLDASHPLLSRLGGGE